MRFDSLELGVGCIELGVGCIELGVVSLTMFLQTSMSTNLVIATQPASGAKQTDFGALTRVRTNEILPPV